MRRKRTQIPTSGRLSTTNMRLPIHIEATTPQNRSGRSVITRGPGAMPWIIRAPIIIAMVGFDGRPSVSIGMNEVCAPALLADSGAATPRISPWPNARGGLGDLPLERIGPEGGSDRAAARQHAQERAEHRAARDRRHTVADVGEARPHPADAAFDDGRAFLLLEIVGDLGDAVDRHRQRHELDAVGEPLEAEIEAADAGV